MRIYILQCIVLDNAPAVWYCIGKSVYSEVTMDYLTIVSIVFGIIWGIFFLLLFHYVAFTVIGIFKKRRFPSTEEKKKYGIIISARNEEAVIGALLRIDASGGCWLLED